ncbi:unnamed protein product [Mytilus edulis]|uniref:Reverse transcriptase domain-containing protein n=1 Tax=Mytilus edulis TaxID=6550 RepID=A0A8S3SA66_MYTED|nr:unnamed protein product [Mytilus edulis]
MPFGLQNSPAVFSQLMEIVLQDLNFAISYIDDILIFSETLEEHFDHIQQVFDRLRQHNLKLKLKKCQFLQEETNYLGFKINIDGVKPDDAKVEAIKTLPNPITVKEFNPKDFASCDYKEDDQLSVKECTIPGYDMKIEQSLDIELSEIINQINTETFRSPSEVGNINIKPSIIVGWIITSKLLSDIEENSYITALVEFGTSIISEFSYCRQHPDYKEHMVIQLLNILSVMFRFMSIHRRWGPVDFRMERIVDKLAMKEELDIIKFSMNNDWDLQGHDTNLKPSKIKKIVNHGEANWFSYGSPSGVTLTFHFNCLL